MRQRGRILVLSILRLAIHAEVLASKTTVRVKFKLWMELGGSLNSPTCCGLFGRLTMMGYSMVVYPHILKWLRKATGLVGVGS